MGSGAHGDESGGSGKTKAEKELNEKRKNLLTDALTVAMDGANCDKRVTTRDERDGVELDLPRKVEKTIEAVKEDLMKTHKQLDGMTTLGLKKVVPPSAKVAPAPWEYDVPPTKKLKAAGQQAQVQVRLRKAAAANRAGRVEGGSRSRVDPGARSRVAPAPAHGQWKRGGFLPEREA